MSDQETQALLAQIAALKAENAKLAENQAKPKVNTTKLAEGISCGVALKSGALSIYGLGGFPITLYKRQWLKLIPVIGQIKNFIDTHPELSDPSEAEMKAMKAAKKAAAGKVG